jgi:hypothetical protein
MVESAVDVTCIDVLVAAEVEAVSDEEQGGRGATDRQQQRRGQHGHDGDMESEPQAPEPQGPTANKSVAEMLRAKLKVGAGGR